MSKEALQKATTRYLDSIQLSYKNEIHKLNFIIKSKIDSTEIKIEKLEEKIKLLHKK